MVGTKQSMYCNKDIVMLLRDNQMGQERVKKKKIMYAFPHTDDILATILSVYKNQ